MRCKFNYPRALISLSTFTKSHRLLLVALYETNTLTDLEK